MTISPDHYEKLGSFYLGRGYDPEGGQLQDDLILYDSKDLVTHGVVLGMTGSGKTGLCLALLEEAAMDGIPVIAVDPKGDIGNALLTFPNLSAEEFAPWINIDDARRQNLPSDAYAEQQAQLWQKGLADWGQDAARIRKLRETVDMGIYTPGSNTGLPVSILGSLGRPEDAVMDDSEALAAHVESTASSLLGLAGIDGDPVQSPEHILLANILTHTWHKGENVTLEGLVRHIQQPPMRAIGVMDMETFMPEARRTALAMKLNNVMASPGFGLWLQGEPLDIQRLYYTAEGKPRVSIFNIAHLNDAERMFFVSLLLNQLVAWMRNQQGTTSLRALFYMDEIFGFLPPTAMPPSKKPMMILLKQARAFGLGLLLATQNPVDLDYKALSNIGTWWLGRLQTERDKARLLDGLKGAMAGSGANTVARLETLISALKNRVFLMHNIHEDAPAVFHVRWVMSYLAGPLARDQIKRLMDPLRRSKEAGAATQADSGFLPPSATRADAGAPRQTERPRLPEGAAEYFAPTHLEAARLVYVPALLRSAVITLEDAKRGIDGTDTVTRVNAIDTANQRVLWDQFIDLPGGVTPNKMRSEPIEGAEFADLPAAALKSGTYATIRKDFADWVYANHRIEVMHAPLLGAFAKPGEPLDAFRARISQTIREKRDAAIDQLRAKHAKEAKALETKAARAMQKVETQRSQASTAKLATAVQVGGSLLGAFFGRKSGLGSLMKVTNVTSTGRAVRESQEAAAAESDLKRVQADLAELAQRLETETEGVRAQFDPTSLEFETVKLSPVRKNIQVTDVGILWLPHERVGTELRLAYQP